MIRLHVAQDLSQGVHIELDAGHSRYLTAVMRQAVGDLLAVFNGRDGEWRAKIAQVAKRSVTLVLEQQLRTQTRGPDLDLVIALVKRARLETIVEKAAELGVRRIRVMTTERTNADHTRVDRLQAIAVEASEQTGRLDVPEVVSPLPLARLLEDWDGRRRLIFCDEAGEAMSVADALADAPRDAPWAVLVGPEGGFSPAERQRLRALACAIPVSLGPRILRADTAAISALTLWQAMLGDWAS